MNPLNRAPEYRRGDVWIGGSEPPGRAIIARGNDDLVDLTLDELRWLIITAGPALLHQLTTTNPKEHS